MASAFTHAFAAVALGKICCPVKPDWLFWTLAVGSAVLPDADVIGFAFGINYGDKLGHRGLFHSILFALLWGLLIVFLAFRQVPRYGKKWWGLAGFFFLVTVSHGVLDAMTNGGLGIAFFAPFDPGRYFFPWRPIKVSPISVANFFSYWGAEVMLSEIKYVWLPLLLVWLCASVLRMFHQRGTK